MKYKFQLHPHRTISSEEEKETFAQGYEKKCVNKNKMRKFIFYYLL